MSWWVPHWKLISWWSIMEQWHANECRKNIQQFVQCTSECGTIILRYARIERRDRTKMVAWPMTMQQRCTREFRVKPKNTRNRTLGSTRISATTQIVTEKMKTSAANRLYNQLGSGDLLAHDGVSRLVIHIGREHHFYQ